MPTLHFHQGYPIPHSYSQPSLGEVTWIILITLFCWENLGLVVWVTWTTTPNRPGTSRVTGKIWGTYTTWLYGVKAEKLTLCKTFFFMPCHGFIFFFYLIIINIVIVCFICTVSVPFVPNQLISSSSIYIYSISSLLLSRLPCHSGQSNIFVVYIKWTTSLLVLPV